MPDIWFGSDHHFGHKNIIPYCNRPFESTEEMDEMLIQWHNELVKPNDIFYQLGDLALGRFEDSIKKAARLQGMKLLVPGNHDRVWSTEKESRQERFRPMYEEAGFDILSEQFVVDLDLAGEVAVLLSHLPSEGDSQKEERYADMRPETGLPILCGHVHDEWTTKGRNFNVGVDVHDFRPVHLDEVLAWIDSL